MSELVLYKSKDGSLQLNISLTNDNLWLSQEQMACYSILADRQLLSI